MPVTPAKYSILGLTLSVLAIVLSALVGPGGTQGDKAFNAGGTAAEFEMIDAGFIPGGAKAAPAKLGEKLNC
jgi:hypothetical protein